MFGWFQSEQAAIRRRNADRAGQVGAHLKRSHARSDRRCRAATGPARCARRVPQVVCAAKDRIVRLNIGEHGGHVGFPHENTARLKAAGRHGAIGGWHVIQRGEAGGGAHTRRRMGILQGEGHAMERSPHLPGRQRGIGSFRPCLCLFRIQRNDRVQRGIVGGNLRQLRVEDVDCGHVAGPNSSSQLRGTGEHKIYHACSSLG